jgi:dTDP-glucose 4,6-dehydratase|tara:strand:- start:5434 stop:6321 length:888 start_codon:yes stop_codon:yes gene_type:complete
MKIVVTGGLGFIGSAFTRLAVNEGAHVVVIDNMTYAADKSRLNGYTYDFVYKNICEDISWACKDAHYIVNFAAESHVDKSIDNGLPFVKSNIQGTYNLIEIARKLPTLKRFVQISTDEVYGDIAYQQPSSESDTLHPSSYYSATKAAAEMLVMAAGRTYNLPHTITRTCNNFGIEQHNEKFLPTIFNSIKNDEPIPIYGDGEQIREWMWVEDNVKIIWDLMLEESLLNTGPINIGSGDRWTNKEVVQKIGELLGKKVKYKFVEDRLGHDRKYALNTSLNGIPKLKTLEEYLKEQV